MIIFLILLAYIASVFLCRFIDIEYAWWKYRSGYKNMINPVGWLFSVIYLLVLLFDYLKETIYNKRRDTKTNKFLKWFLVSKVKDTKKDKILNDNMEELFNDRKRKEKDVIY